VYGGKGISYVIHSNLFKIPPPPISCQGGEPPQGVRLYHAPFFQIFKGCHITLKSLILIVFCLPVNFLFVPLLDCYWYCFLVCL